MQGLAHYDDSPSPPASGQAGPSRPRSDRPGTGAPVTVPQKRKKDDVERLPENLTRTSQAVLHDSELSKETVATEEDALENEFSGMSEEEILRRITRPADIEGLRDWGIPPAVNPEESSPQLKAKVAQYLRLKYDHNQHINTSLLSSSSFANPHIYAKLVEFVDLSERATAFPGDGWVTRKGLEGERGKYGPKKMSEEQKRRQEAVKRSQEVGKRSTIDFKSSSRDKDRGAERIDRERGDRGRDKGDRGQKRSYPEMDRRERSRLLGSSGIGSNRRDRDGGWDERDMNRDKDRPRR